MFLPKEGTIPSVSSEADGDKFIDEDIVRKINLLEILQEDFPDIDPPPEDCVGKSRKQARQMIEKGERNYSFYYSFLLDNDTYLTHPFFLSIIQQKKHGMKSKSGLTSQDEEENPYQQQNLCTCDAIIFFFLISYFNASFSSPFSLSSMMISAPPTNSPFTYT